MKFILQAAHPFFLLLAENTRQACSFPGFDHSQDFIFLSMPANCFQAGSQAKARIIPGTQGQNPFNIFWCGLRPHAEPAQHRGHQVAAVELLILQP
jgi:hypothetical protein